VSLRAAAQRRAIPFVRDIIFWDGSLFCANREIARGAHVACVSEDAKDSKHAGYTVIFPHVVPYFNLFQRVVADHVSY
jgi:hypothetical protein